MTRLLQAVREVLQAAVPGGFQIATHTVPLKDVEQAWTAEGDKSRIVFEV